jgi:hypothetical protein
MSIDLNTVSGAEFLAMNVEDQRRVLTEVYRELCYRDISDWSQEAINIIEALGINDYKTTEARVDIPLGFLRATAQLMKQCFTEQHRRELQVLSQQTEFAAGLAEEIYDRADEIAKLTEELLTYQTYYHAALQHRKENVHLLDADGGTVPYSRKEIETEQQLQEKSYQQWSDALQQKRDALEAAYWGTVQPPELEPGGEAQLIIPLWTAGFGEIEKGSR